MLKTAIVIFSRNKTRAWSGKKLTLMLRSFLKLESFGYIVITTETSLMNNIKENVLERVIITEV